MADAAAEEFVVRGRETLRAESRATWEELQSAGTELDNTTLRNALLRLNLRAACLRHGRPGKSVIQRYLTCANGALFGVVALAVYVLIANNLPASEVSTQLEIEADSVTMVVERPVDILLQRSVTGLTIRGAGAIEYPRATKPRARSESASAFAVIPQEAEHLLLDRLHVPRGAELTLATAPEWRIEVRRPKVTDASDRPHVVWRQDNRSQIRLEPQTQLAPAEWQEDRSVEVDEGIGSVAQVYAQGIAGQAFVIAFAPEELAQVRWMVDTLAGVPARAPSFVTPEDEGGVSSRMLSSIRSGQVVLTGFERTPFTIHELEHLTLTSVRGRILSVALAAESVRLLWEGRVSSMRAGHPPDMRKLMPSKLEAQLPNKQARQVTGVVLYAALFALSLRRVRTPDQPDLPAGLT